MRSIHHLVQSKQTHPMNQLTELLPKIFAVEIPEGAHSFFTLPSNLHIYYLLENKYHHSVNLPSEPGSYSILFSTKDAGEEEWKLICEPASNEYYDGCKDYTEGVSAFHSFTESGLSLLRSKALDTNKNYLIIKKD